MKPKKQSQTPPPVTMPAIVAAVNSIVPRSERSIRADIAALGIESVGKRQRPQRYPWNAAERIVIALGYESALMQSPVRSRSGPTRPYIMPKDYFPKSKAKLPPLDTALSALNRIPKGKATR